MVLFLPLIGPNIIFFRFHSFGVWGKEEGKKDEKSMKNEFDVNGENLTERGGFQKGSEPFGNVIKDTFSFVQKCKSVNCRQRRKFFKKRFLSPQEHNEDAYTPVY